MIRKVSFESVEYNCIAMTTMGPREYHFPFLLDKKEALF